MSIVPTLIDLFLLQLVVCYFRVLYISFKGQGRDVVQNPADKEMHAHDNDVMAL